MNVIELRTRTEAWVIVDDVGRLVSWETFPSKQAALEALREMVVEALVEFDRMSNGQFADAAERLRQLDLDEQVSGRDRAWVTERAYSNLNPLPDGTIGEIIQEQKGRTNSDTDEPGGP